MQDQGTLGQVFSEWQQLTDEYASAIAEMEAGHPGALLRARELGAQLLRDHPELAKPIGQLLPLADTDGRLPNDAESLIAGDPELRPVPKDR